ncbi:hypothetical protein GCM10027176_17620 [Actinoallomurus bryophytorum]|uniref:Uncharacterized protein n=1 Tax=Actinoallomurus bryophytorum TaxID=1490222 RepID=A0A543CLH9_9ACTN|nr:hypothetical protein [Actinoallomurus bryophytorum]TQL97949.1 hypothetical protein FB559_3560 [Actinoallomurus bryophytorum]
MGAWRGWIAAVLLTALAFTCGPDVLDASSPAGQTTVVAGEFAEKLGSHVRDDAIDIRHQIADRGSPAHLRLPALPPSPQTAAPVPVKGQAQAVPMAVTAAITDAGGRPHLGACSPEALQIFRC